MRLSPDQIILWQYGFLKLNGTIAFTLGSYGRVGARIDACHAQAFHGSETLPAGRTYWKSSLRESRSKSRMSASASRKSISAFWARFFCSLPWPVSARSYPAMNPRPARSRPLQHSRCAYWWRCRSSVYQGAGPGWLPQILRGANKSSCCRSTLSVNFPARWHWQSALFGNMMSGTMIPRNFADHYALHIPDRHERAWPALHRYGSGLHLGRLLAAVYIASATRARKPTLKPAAKH